MNKDLLLEIGMEEMPALLIPEALKELEKQIEKELANARLEYDSIWTGATPRRLALIIKGIPVKQPDAVKEVRGPKAVQAYDADNQPTRALLGFARGQGVTVEDITVKELGNTAYAIATKKEAGLDAINVLSETLHQVIKGISFQRSMRWGYSEMRFIRPIRWMTAMFGSEVVSLEIENVKAGNMTYGHRFLSPGPIPLNGAKDYVEALRKSYVLVDVEERRDWIWEQVQRVAADYYGGIIRDDELLEEVTFLVEYPTAFAGKFSMDYLIIPSEVLVTSMKEHQRYFPVVDSDGRLMPMFIGVRNGIAENIEVVAQGNERVLKARLEDAHFFFREDTKTPLETKVELLKNVIYQARLGTVWVKIQRLRGIAEFVGRELGFTETNLIDRAALLCKADLETGMVGEFPELQGIMGRHYALIGGEDPSVAQAISEHYQPRFAGDQIPASPVGIAVSLAEKFDNLVGNFAIGVKPSGSQDPYALRRQALGIVAIVLEGRLTLNLEGVIRYTYKEFAAVLDLSEDQVVDGVLDFIMQRLRGVLNEAGFSYDVVDAVLENRGPDLLLIQDKARALASLKEQQYFNDLMVVFNRPFNLSRQAGDLQVQPNLFAEQVEQELYDGLLKLYQVAQPYLEKRDYLAYFEAIAGLRPLLDDFFAKIMVMVEDQAIRDNRLGLLKMVVKMFLPVADFSKIIG